MQEAEERLTRQGREWSARERQLEAASAAATLEVRARGWSGERETSPYLSRRHDW